MKNSSYSWIICSKDSPLPTSSIAVSSTAEIVASASSYRYSPAKGWKVTQNDIIHIFVDVVKLPLTVVGFSAFFTQHMIWEFHGSSTGVPQRMVSHTLRGLVKPMRLPTL